MRSGYGAEGRLSSAKVVAKHKDGTTVLVQLPLPMLHVMVDVCRRRWNSSPPTADCS